MFHEKPLVKVKYPLEQATKVKYSLEQATKAQKSESIALLFL